MSALRPFLSRHSLIIGTALMFLVTWTIDLSHSGVLPFRVPFFVALSVGWGFIVVALGMTGLTLGREALLALCKRYLIWRVNWRWYAVALLLLPALQLIAVLLTAWLTAVPADFSQPLIRDVVPLSAPLLLLILPWLLFEIVTNGEEIGWRGYILPRLQARHSALVASLVVGLLWSTWHLPKFWGTGANHGRSFIWYMLFSLAASVLYTWLYNNTRGSLLLVTLFHASDNTAGMFLPISFAATGGVKANLLIVLVVVTAVVVTRSAGPARLSRTEAKQVQRQDGPGNAYLQDTLREQDSQAGTW